MQRMINSHVEASKIGRQIADQVLDYQRRIGDTSSESSPDPDQTNNINTTLAGTINSLSNEHTLPDRLLPPVTTSQRPNGTLPGYAHIQNNALSSPEASKLYYLLNLY